MFGNIIYVPSKSIVFCPIRMVRTVYYENKRSFSVMFGILSVALNVAIKRPHVM